jgi:hypothetical protein
MLKRKKGFCDSVLGNKGGRAANAQAKDFIFMSFFCTLMFVVHYTTNSVNFNFVRILTCFAMRNFCTNKIYTNETLQYIPYNEEQC